MALWYVSNSGSDSNTGVSQAQAYATIGKAISSASSGDTIAIQTGTYTLTSTLAVTFANIIFQGYQTTPGDNGTAPLITTATNSTVLFTSASAGPGTNSWLNLSFSNTASTRAIGIQKISNDGTSLMWAFAGCTFDGFTVALDAHGGSGSYAVAYFGMTACEVKNCSGDGIYLRDGILQLATIFGSYIHNNGGVGLDFYDSGSLVSMIIVDHSIFASNTSGGLIVGLDDIGVISNSTFANNAGYGILATGGSSYPTLTVYNSIFYGNGTYGIDLSASLSGVFKVSRNNAFGNNTSGNTGWTTSPYDITLTANPFTNSSSGNYSLNSTSGGGAACKGAGYPGAFQGGTSTGFLDIGAVPTSGGSGGGGGGSFAFIS